MSRCVRQFYAAQIRPGRAMLPGRSQLPGESTPRATSGSKPLATAQPHAAVIRREHNRQRSEAIGMSMASELAAIDAEISACHDKYLIEYFAGRTAEADELGAEVDRHLAERWAVMQKLDDGGWAAT